MTTRFLCGIKLRPIRTGFWGKIIWLNVFRGRLNRTPGNAVQLVFEKKMYAFGKQSLRPRGRTGMATKTCSSKKRMHLTSVSGCQRSMCMFSLTLSAIPSWSTSKVQGLPRRETTNSTLKLCLQWDYVSLALKALSLTLRICKACLSLQSSVASTCSWMWSIVTQLSLQWRLSCPIWRTSTD